MIVRGVEAVGLLKVVRNGVERGRETEAAGRDWEGFARKACSGFYLVVV